MATWIFSPSPGGECCECRASVCDECDCTWGGEFDAGGEEHLPYNASWNVSAYFVSAHDISIELFAPSGSETQFVIKADGVTIYNSGCIGSSSGPTVTTTATVPAGTVSLSIDITQCEGTLNEWDFVLGCA
jgi:hypothetical protein